MMYPVAEISPGSNFLPACMSLDDPLGGRFSYKDDIRSPLASSETHCPSRLSDAVFHAEIPEDGILSVRRGEEARTMDRTCPDEHAVGPAKWAALTERALEMHGMFSPGEILGSH